VDGSLTSIPSLLLLAAIAFGIGLTVAVVVRNNGAANRVLAALVLCVTLIVLHYTLLWTGVASHVPHALGFSWPLWFLIGPLYYLYIRRLTRPVGRNIGVLAHFFPAVFSLGDLVSFYQLSAATKLSYIEEMYAGTGALKAGVFVILAMRIIHMGFYVYLSTVEMREFTGEYKRRSASDAIASLELFRWITIPFVVYLTVSTFDLLILYLFSASRTWIDYLNVVALVGFVVTLCCVGMRQSMRLFEALDETDTEKYRKARIPDDQAKGYIARLKRVMATERLYLKGDLRLHHLASSLGMSTHNLSQLLNQSLNTSFYDFVNQYRVEYAKQRLRAPESRDYTLVSIAHEVGFSSKASFNRAFKKLTNMTPSQFQDSASQHNEPHGDDAPALT